MLKVQLGRGVLISAIFLSACGQNAPASKQQATAQRTTTPGNAIPDGGNQQSAKYTTITARLMSAAETFEVLAEAAFNPSGKVDQAIQAASTSVQDVRGILPGDSWSQLNKNLEAIHRAHTAHDPAGLALASIENYRALVSAVPGKPVVPVDVNLLDYAGFRFDADAQAHPSRWDDMVRALDFARTHWVNVRPQISDPKLVQRFEQSLSDMERGARAHNLARSRAAAKAELDLVDQLETVFKQRGQGKG